MNFLVNSKKITLVYSLLASFFIVEINAQDICEIIDGSKVIADDGKYLGKICNAFDSESIINEFGTYGNEFNSNCGNSQNYN